MAWILGFDEAGYGPNLGPLVIGTTAWQVDHVEDLYLQLRDAITDAPSQEGRLAIADSKQLYKPRGGLGNLERAVLAALGMDSSSWLQLVDRLQADPAQRGVSLPWHQGFDVALPTDAHTADIDTGEQTLRVACQAAGIRPPTLRARLVYPEEFNTLVAHHGTKGAALSHVTIALARQQVEQVAALDAPFHATFDKHGGRNRYGALLQEHFPERLVVPQIESRSESRYHWGDSTFCFRSGGEAVAEVALASMTAKLLRELAMRALNQFWKQHVPNLQPTAGYPVDAKRFWAEIQAKRKALGIEEHLLWRSR